MNNSDLDKLVQTMEECGELIQAISKYLRFGPESFHPATPETSNAKQVGIEAGNVLAMIDQLSQLKLVASSDLEIGYQQKGWSLIEYAKHVHGADKNDRG